MTKTVPVTAHVRKIEKPEAYISMHVALITRKEDQDAFLARHGIKTVSLDDPRLAAPIPAPANGSAPSKGGIIANLKALAGWK